jgi:glycine dehydrogenase
VITATAIIPISALVCLISYGYICMLGAEGITDAPNMQSKCKLHERLRRTIHFKVEKRKIAHEMILDCRGQRKRN